MKVENKHMHCVTPDIITDGYSQTPKILHAKSWRRRCFSDLHIQSSASGDFLYLVVFLDTLRSLQIKMFQTLFWSKHMEVWSWVWSRVWRMTWINESGFKTTTVVLHCITVYYSVLHCIILCYSILHCISLHYSVLYCVTLYYTVLHCVTLYYTVLHCIILCYSVLHCVTFLYMFLRIGVLMCVSYYIPSEDLATTDVQLKVWCKKSQSIAECSIKLIRRRSEKCD